MKQYYLHIGLHKTGSSFIQKKIFEKINSDDYYIITPKSQINQKILEFLSTKDLKLKKEISNYLEKINKQKIIYSSEGLFGFSMDGFKDVKSRFLILEELFYNPKYVIFYREPSDILYSHYFQGLRGLYLYEDFIEYTTKDLKLLSQEIPKRFAQGTNYKLFDYNELFKNYLEIKDRVLFINYNDFYFFNREKNLINLQNFLDIKINISINFENKTNPSQKKLIYFIFYNKFILFKLLKILILRIFLFFSKFKIFKSFNFRHIIANSIELVILCFNIIFKLFNSKKLKEYENRVFEHKEIIKSYHFDSYENFKKKLDK